MVSEEEVYDLVEEYRDAQGVGEAGYLAALGLSRSDVATHLEVRYRTDEPLEVFLSTFLELVGGTDVEWEGAEIEIVFEDETRGLDDLDLEESEGSVAGALRTAHEEVSRDQATTHTREFLASDALTPVGRKVAAIVLRDYRTTYTDTVDEAFLWSVYRLVESETFQLTSRIDILNELVRAGCVAAGEDELYVLPGLAALPDPEQHLPSVEFVPPGGA